MARRTAAVDIDQPFSCDGEVTKAYEDKETGERFIRGVASGIEEDRDGERVSARAIRKMAAQPVGDGQVTLTARHDEDWIDEIGEVVKIEHDADTDELLIDTKLPAPGVDPIADKAWNRLKNGKKLGFSIGGRLRKAFYELVERPNGVAKRKVLDEIALSHVCLTQRPSYRTAFAEAVAKTFTDAAPDADDAQAWMDADAFLDTEAPVAKATPQSDEEQDEDGTQDPAGGDLGTQPSSDTSEDGKPAPDPSQGGDEDEPEDGKGEQTDAEADQQAAERLPVARHLACPSCGHEFAAPLEADEGDSRHDAQTAAESTAKTTPIELDMAKITTLNEALEAVRVMAAQEAATAQVTKTEAADADADSDVATIAKAVSTIHEAHKSELAELEQATRDGFETVAKTLDAVLDQMRPGRKSVARQDGVPTRGEQAAAEAGETVGKTVREEMEAADDALGALKALTRRQVEDGAFGRR